MFKWLFGSKGEAAAEVGGNAEIIVISRRVKAPREAAFATFVDRMGTWWPREMTWAGENLSEIRVEPNRGGRALEISKNGGEQVWGTVLGLHRPEHIVIAWQKAPSGAPEASEASASRIDVRFVAVDADTTDVVVVHRDFPRHGDGWQAYRATMASKNGWPRLIDLYAKTFAGG